MRRVGRLRGLIATGIGSACICALLGSAGAALGRGSSALHAVRYHGASIRVPRSWPVFELARSPQTCVRFNRHALYLGTPGRDERCPADAVGRTEAILVSPLLANRGSPSATAAGLELNDGDATSFSLRSAGVEVTATWSRARRVVSRALGRGSFSAANRGTTNAPGNAAPSTPATAAEQSVRSSATDRVYTGLGFDTCMAPSLSQMSAWSASPYRAVGIYLGGINSACAQPNLSKGWVHHEIASGWHPIPTFVGLQAPDNECGCAPMSTDVAHAKAQGEVAASHAVTQARRLGIRPGNPIYNDMEGYPIGGYNTPAVLAFLAGWTSGLHSAGYLSGVYSSGSSGVSDLASMYGTRYPEPNDIWIADWNGLKTTEDPNVPEGDWSNHQRLHQYAGNQTESYGGVTLTVDDDFLNGATAGARGAQGGYMLLTSRGGVNAFGAISSYGGDAHRLPAGVRAVAFAKDPRTGGYWILRSDGGVNGFHAPWHRSLMRHLHGMRPVALAGSPAGGYLVLTSNGEVHRFGPIRSYGGDAGALARGVRAIALARDPRTGGYWILTSDGGISSFHAPWEGSLRHKPGGTAAVALAAARQGGYFILTSNGGVHHFGPARWVGSDAGKLSAGVRAVSLATSQTVPGYRILLSNGGVNCFGAFWHGSLAGKLPRRTRPVTIADVPG